jgi:hypothetical protein
MIPQHLNLHFPLILAALVAVAVVILVFKLALAFRGGPKFKLKSSLLGAAEQTLYYRLIEALPDHVVLAQVAFSQMITVAGGDSDENFKKNLSARQKVADFVICDRSFSVVAVVELDDSTHSAAKDEKRDAIVTEAGSRTIRWRAGRLPDTADIKRRILGA